MPTMVSIVRARQTKVGRPEPRFGVEAVEHVQPQPIEIVHAHPRVDGVEHRVGIVAVRQLEIVRRELGGTTLDPVEAGAIVSRRGDEAIVDEALRQRLLVGVEEVRVRHAKYSRAVAQI
ncbi:hypothetical protein ACVMFA_000288 [Bradyrhizobium liaoningense]